MNPDWIAIAIAFAAGVIAESRLGLIAFLKEAVKPRQQTFQLPPDLAEAIKKIAEKTKE